MQNIDLICVGKLNAKYFAEGVAEYQKRLACRVVCVVSGSFPHCRVFLLYHVFSFL